MFPLSYNMTVHEHTFWRGNLPNKPWTIFCGSTDVPACFKNRWDKKGRKRANFLLTTKLHWWPTEKRSRWPILDCARKVIWFDMIKHILLSPSRNNGYGGSFLLPRAHFHDTFLHKQKQVCYFNKTRLIFYPAAIYC